MKKEVPCSGLACLMNTVAYDDDNPETIATHVVCDECQEAAEANRRRLVLIADLASGFIEDRDLEQVERLLNHLFGRQKDKALTAAGFYSMTLAKRKKIKRQMDDEFGPQIPEPL
jgi:hypothetical protein